MAYKFCCNAGTRLIIRLAAVQGEILKNTRKINPTLGLTMLGIGLLQACGGGSSAPAPAPAPVPLTMNCVDGAGYQCSGSSSIRGENGVTLTRSGVQVYGRSTGDVLNPTNPNITTGLALASGGIAEFRTLKNGSGTTQSTALLLKDLGIRWDAVTERPQIIELFNPTAGRVTLDSNGALTLSALPASSNLTFYDFATLGKNGTQANYANNRYFPRADPARCTSGPCPTELETAGVSFTQGAWRNGLPEVRPDLTGGGNRLHEDGDIHAGDGPNGSILPGGTGHGVPFPGSKGARSIVQWSYRYSNIGYWFTQDTVDLAEWSAPGNFEHNTARTGVVTFGEVTDPSTTPTTGTVTYSGFVYGGYAANGVVDQVNFTGLAAVTVNFAARTVVVTISNCVESGTTNVIPISFTSTTSMGSAGEANYSTGTVSGALSGGLSSRFFGPVAVGGPAEVGGAFSLSNTSGAAVVGGFIAYR